MVLMRVFTRSLTASLSTFMSLAFRALATSCQTFPRSFVPLRNWNGLASMTSLYSSIKSLWLSHVILKKKKNKERTFENVKKLALLQSMADFPSLLTPHGGLLCVCDDTYFILSEAKCNIAEIRVQIFSL